MKVIRNSRNKIIWKSNLVNLIIEHIYRRTFVPIFPLKSLYTSQTQQKRLKLTKSHENEKPKNNNLP